MQRKVIIWTRNVIKKNFACHYMSKTTLNFVAAIKNSRHEKPIIGF